MGGSRGEGVRGACYEKGLGSWSIGNKPSRLGGGEGGTYFVACLGHLSNDHASLSRRS